MDWEDISHFLGDTMLILDDVQTALREMSRPTPETNQAFLQLRKIVHDLIQGSHTALNLVRQLKN
jgi:hypothetical protein